MATTLTSLTHKIAIQLHVVAESCTIEVLVSGGQFTSYNEALTDALSFPPFNLKFQINHIKNVVSVKR
jgi:hypothetical protein